MKAKVLFICLTGTLGGVHGFSPGRPATAVSARELRGSRGATPICLRSSPNGAELKLSSSPPSQYTPALNDMTTPALGSVALGSVSLVGAGPGDPELLTVKAARVLGNPDALVVADRLVSGAVLELVKGELRVARKLPGCAEQAQQEIYRWVSEAVLRGRSVVRLKIGDPFVFGRGSEEVLWFRDHLGVECDVVPGVSAAFASPLLGGIPVTHRGVANQVVMSTGYGKEESKPDIQAYHPETTAVFLMAVGRLPELCHRLQTEASYPSTCPSAIVEQASLSRQRVVVGTVATIASLAAELDIKPPATIVFGHVVTVLHGDGASGVVHVPSPGQVKAAS